MEGPATDALEQLKRKRSGVKHNTALDQFSFQEIFCDLTALEKEEVFPVICWNFDDNEDEHPPALLRTVKPSTAGHLGLKRSRSSEPGLRRSKSFKKDLSLLASSSSFDNMSSFATVFEPLSIKLDDTVQTCPHKISTAEVFAPLLSSRSSTNHEPCAYYKESIFKLQHEMR